MKKRYMTYHGQKYIDQDAKAANKEQRRRRKANQREGQRLQLWAARNPRAYQESCT